MRSAGWFFLLSLWAAGEARGCSIPVFRYALEHWQPSRYEVRVFHRGRLDARRRSLVEQLRAAGPLNANVTTSDVTGKLSGEVEKAWRRSAAQELPRLVVFSGDEDEEGPPVWSVRLEETAVRRLLGSPARRRIVELLGKGESVVWVLLGSGDKKADDAAERLLNKELPRLRAAMPPLERKAGDDLRSSLPLRISFAVVRLEREKEEEAFFVRTLLECEEGLAEARGPIVFPVFGRGRVLLGLHGEQLSPEALERWAGFLCGPCSCRVKEATLGSDLLLVADWDELLGADPEQPPPAAVSAPAIPPGSAVGEDDLAAEAAPTGDRWWLWGAGAGALAALFTCGRVIRSRARPLSG
jgi:hypothetical protein